LGVTLVLGIGLPAASLLFYWLRGDPGAMNADRSALSLALLNGGLPDSAEAAQRLQAELGEHLARQPDDPRALVLKARLDMRAERFNEAVAAYAKACRAAARPSTMPASGPNTPKRWAWRRAAGWPANRCAAAKGAVH
jgi:cytochrome c-type biogenesis protein CcmH/NrfG